MSPFVTFHSVMLPVVMWRDIVMWRDMVSLVAMSLVAMLLVATPWERVFPIAMGLVRTGPA
ncbi:hypothetical protein [Frankia sp. AiPa1]|uniref:hypothetical protein n=1 Tax=Frankia sp. AiPa1 TaxID=573492 RepID=UPI00202B3B98|nr:hypothetical protein [Frankia sp. AiPa1]MCL9760690.1 hypothetical protein [Frankia sp. AiPa1]